jgi:cytochrome oxidase assembly protein ShyY1
MAAAIRTWALRTIAGLALVLVCVRLGLWQLDRNEQRSARNAIIEANLHQAPAPIDTLVAPNHPLDPHDEWRPAQITGHYDAAHELVLRLRPVHGERGVHALTPLVTSSGAAVLVDRGYVSSMGVNDDQVAIPPPPAGQVRVVARMRLSEDDHGLGSNPASGTIRYVNLDEAASVVGHPLYGGWAELTSQEPQTATRLDPIPPPETDAGPHLSYAIQWFLFATIGVGGFVMLVRSEVLKRDSPTPQTGHPRTGHPPSPTPSSLENGHRPSTQPRTVDKTSGTPTSSGRHMP